MKRMDSVVTTLSTLADAGRLRILLMLATAAEHCVGDVAKRLGAPVSSVSQALATLKLSGLVCHRRDGNRVFYRVAPGLTVEADWLVIRVPLGEVRVSLAGIDPPILRAA